MVPNAPRHVRSSAAPWRCGAWLLLLALVACSTPPPAGPRSFTEKDLAQLKFLEGRWQGRALDGSAFYEEYTFADPRQLRTRRFADAAFTKPTESSSVALKNGDVVSTWGAFSWKAVALAPGSACFEPLKAPTTFCWERVDATHVNVTQRWTDAAGKTRSHVLPLTLLPRR